MSYRFDDVKIFRGVASYATASSKASLLVMPSDLVPLIAELQSTNERLGRVELVVTGGEPVWPELMQAAAAVPGNGQLRFRSTFQTSQAGTIGFQCQHLPSNEYHIHEELQLVEIDSNSGELATTNLDRTYMPVVRMKTGDIAEFVNQECLCLRRLSLIQIASRVGQRACRRRVRGLRPPMRISAELA